MSGSFGIFAVAMLQKFCALELLKLAAKLFQKGVRTKGYTQYSYPTITECFGQSNCRTCGVAIPKSRVWMAICQAHPLVEKSLQVSLEGLRMIAKHFAQAPSSKIFHLHHHHTQHHPHCKNTQVNHWSWPIRASKMVAALSSEPCSRLLQRLISHKFQRKKKLFQVAALSEEGCRLEFVHLTWPVKNHNSFRTHKVLKLRQVLLWLPGLSL